MGIRMSSNQFMYNYQNSLQRAYQRQTKLFEQADGSKLHRGSDDAIAYHKYLRYQNDFDENEMYQQNVKDGMSWMKTSDSAMVHMAENMKTFVEKTIHAANDDNNEDDWGAIAKEMDVRIREIVATGNTQLGNRYVFSGQKDIQQPFSISTGIVERGLTKTLDSNQIAFFRNENIDVSSNLSQMLTLEGKVNGETKTLYLDTKTGYLYDKEFMDDGYKDVIAAGVTTLDTDALKKQYSYGYISSVKTYDANTAVSYDGADEFVNGNNNDPDGVKVADFFDNKGLLLGEGYEIKVTITDDNGDPANDDNGSPLDEVDFKFKMIDQYVVTYEGDEKYISMVKMNGAADPETDSVNATGQDMFGTDIFDNADSGNGDTPSGTALLNEMLAVLAKTEAHDSKWLSSDGITVGNVAHNTMTNAETGLGARYQLYESVLTMLETQNVNITDDLTDVSGTDVAKLAVKLMEMSTLYNMSLSMGGRILPQTLADYL